MRVDRTALSWWFPKLVEAGIPVPKTAILHMPEDAQKSIWALFDGKDDGDIKPFVREVAVAASALGYPCFLRTDQTSGKHNWDQTCYLASEAGIAAHISEIAMYSEMADFMGLPWHTWAAREFLPTIPFGVCPNYGNMPINREFRFFVRGGEVICSHPYWPAYALEQGGASGVDFDELCRMPEADSLHQLASRAGAAVGGAWSVDILETKRGWFVTDMAEAHKSFHWPDCPHEAEMRRLNEAA